MCSAVIIIHILCQRQKNNYTDVQNICVPFEPLLALQFGSCEIVQFGLIGVRGWPSVGCSYHAKISVVTHWKKRNVHWTKMYHIMLAPSAPRKNQNICGMGGVNSIHKGNFFFIN